MARPTKPKKLKPAPRAPAAARGLEIERVQLGVRLEKRMVKVLKAMAEYGDMTLGELLEDIVLHAFEGGTAQTFGPDEVKVIENLKKVYGMNYDTHASYQFRETSSEAVRHW
jgi:hypothetical protein